MAPPPPRVFTVPASVPFLPTLARALSDGTLMPGALHRGDPLALAATTIYLPTRRACRLARDAFLDVLDGEAVALPRIVALGDIDEDELAFEEAAGATEPLDLPAPLSPLARRLMLARLALTFAERASHERASGSPLVVGTPAAALALADHLARLIDDMTVREVPWERLDDLVPAELGEYWQLTLQFLTIAREHWPRVLAERSAIEPAARRDRVIAAEAARLARKPDGPVVVAGSTGSMPATARFIAAVARLPHGAVVLPGLDTDLDAASWAAIGGGAARAGEREAEPENGHPQFALHGLLKQLGVDRNEVTVLGEPRPHDRSALLSEALRPARTTHLWRARLAEPLFAEACAAGLAGLAVIRRQTRTTRRWPSQSPCGKRSSSRSARRRSQRRIARSPVASQRRSLAGTSASPIRRARRSPIRRSACSHASLPKRRSAGRHQRRCSRCSSIRSAASGQGKARMRAPWRRSSARCCAAPGRAPERRTCPCARKLPHRT